MQQKTPFEKWQMKSCESKPSVRDLFGSEKAPGWLPLDSQPGRQAGRRNTHKQHIEK